jgi:hypothetical protein
MTMREGHLIFLGLLALSSATPARAQDDEEAIVAADMESPSSRSRSFSTR